MFYQHLSLQNTISLSGLDGGERCNSRLWIAYLIYKNISSLSDILSLNLCIRLSEWEGKCERGRGGVRRRRRGNTHSRIFPKNNCSCLSWKYIIPTLAAYQVFWWWGSVRVLWSLDLITNFLNIKLIDWLMFTYEIKYHGTNNNWKALEGRMNLIRSSVVSYGRQNNAWNP